MSLQPPSFLLMGPAGTGKTSSLATFLKAGLSLRLLTFEPAAPNRILQRCAEDGIDASKFDWKFVSPTASQTPAQKWSAMQENAKRIKNLTLKELADTRGSPDDKPWLEFLVNLANFKSDRTGQSLGDVTDWGPSIAFAIDGLTGMSDAARLLQVGYKPNPNPGEWGSMQTIVLDIIKTLCADCKCFFALIAHVERETNEITGTSNITCSTLGAKLAPRIPGRFSSVVYAKRLGTKFLWSTIDMGVDSKSGDVPLSDEIPPSFLPIVESFHERQKSAGANGKISSTSTEATKLP